MKGLCPNCNTIHKTEDACPGFDLTEDQLQWCRDNLHGFEAMERQVKQSKEQP